MNKVILISFSLLFVALLSYFNMEPAIIKAAATTYGTSTVTLVVASELSIAVGSSSLRMLPNISMSQDTSMGSSTFLVKCSDTGGYTLSFSASTSPAMHNGTANHFNDLATTSMPNLWATKFTGGSAYEFGFSVFGADATSIWGNVVNSTASTTCGWSGSGAGSITDDVTNPRKWHGLFTTATSTATKTSATVKAGVYTTLCVAAQQGPSVLAPSGTYTADVVATANTN